MTYQAAKRVLDIVSALLLILLFTPFWIVVPLAIMLESGTPIIFKHKRVGKDGEEFYLYKFRSMIPEADKILHEQNHKLLEKFKEGDWKIQDDPRITKLGKYLRSFTIDEFPQLFNILKGDMSIVGPRAYVKKELEEQTKRYPSTKKYVPDILSIKPGATGPWQVNGRNEIPFTKRAEIDSQYAKRKSILYDIGIILRTPQAMFSKW